MRTGSIAALGLVLAGALTLGACGSSPSQTNGSGSQKIT